MKVDLTFNWWEFLYSFIGAFFGFSFSLFLEYLFKLNSEKKRRKLLIANIKNELREIRDSLSACTFIDERATIHTPCFDAMINSGIILDSIEERYYSGMMSAYNFCKQYMTKKKRLEEEERIKRCNNDKDLSIIVNHGNTELKELSISVISEIDSFLNR